MIKVIHIARRDLHLDDDTYRSLLGAVVPGKSSCREMTIIELQNVIQALEAKGFKSKPLRRSKRRMSAPSDVSLKIRAIWKTMFNEGFIQDGSDIALDHFVQRQTRIRNGGAGVSSLEWLRADAEDNLLESLKQWHIREMKKAMLAHHARLPENPVTGDESRDYDTICSAYAVAARKVEKMSDDLFGDVQDDSILDHIDDEMESSRFPSLLAELNALLRKELERLGYDPRHSIELVAAISSKIGGMQIYFPRGQVLEQLIRDMRIWRDFKGNNIPELVERYQVTYKTVYKAIRRMRRLELSKRQYSLDME